MSLEVIAFLIKQLGEELKKLKLESTWLEITGHKMSPEQVIEFRKLVKLTLPDTPNNAKRADGVKVNQWEKQELLDNGDRLYISLRAFESKDNK